MTNIIDMTRGVYRRVYSGFIEGDRICSVSVGAEMWFWRLYVLSDDFGNLKADPARLHEKARGKRSKITARQSEGWIAELADAKLIALYECAGDRYIHCLHFEQLQPAGRNGKRVQKVPQPPGGILGNPGESRCNVQEEEQAQKEEQKQPQPHARAAGGGGGVYETLRGEPWEIGVSKAEALCRKHPPEVIQHAIRMAKKRPKAGGGLVVTLLDSGEAARDLADYRDNIDRKRAKALFRQQPKARREELAAEYGNVLGDPLDDPGFVSYLVGLMREAAAQNGATA